MTAVDSIRQTDQQLSMIPAAARQLQVQYVAHADVYPDPSQPRAEADVELKASIAVEGIRQPLTVRRHPEQLGAWMIVDGERRWRGALDVMREIPVIVRDDQDQDAERLMGQLVSNTGKPLTPLEEARAYGKLLGQTGMSQAELADRLGVPRTTFGDRIRLLELGPWIPLLEAGTIPLSIAVEHLIPIRGMPDKYHAQLIESMKTDYRWQRNSKAGAAAMSIHDFGSLIGQLVRPLFYPLTKTKGFGAKQPEFPTAKHDAECSCGGIKFGLDTSDTKRLCCGNPDWWRPLHRKAISAKKKSTGTKKPDAARTPKWAQLPTEASTRKEKYYYQERPNETVLIKAGKWAVDGRGESFDPAVLLEHISAKKLILVESGYGLTANEKLQVVTTDAAAVKAARESYAARWKAKRAMLDAARFAKIEKLRADPSLLVYGLGARHLLAAAIGRDGVSELHSLATLIGLQPPKVKSGYRYDGADQKLVAKWILSLEANAIESLATAFAMQLSGKLGKTQQEELEEKQTSEFDTLSKHPVVWPGTPAKKVKAAAPAKGKRKQVAAEAGDDLELDDDTDDPDLEEDRFVDDDESADDDGIIHDEDEEQENEENGGGADDE